MNYSIEAYAVLHAGLPLHSCGPVHGSAPEGAQLWRGLRSTP